MRFGDRSTRSLLLTLASCVVAHGAVYFEPAPGGGFIGRTPHALIAMESRSAELRTRHSSIRIRFEGASRSSGAGASAAGGVSHYVQGSDRARWRFNVPRYSRVRFPAAYPGIDVVYRAGPRDNVEFDFELAPGARASGIRLAFSVPVRINGAGALEAGGHTLRPPYAWQDKAGVRHAVEVKYRLLASRRVGFHLGAYDHTRPLIIDPVIEFATYLGGSDAEWNTRMVAGADNAVYLAGTTLSPDFPASLPDNSPLNRPVVMYVGSSRVDLQACKLEYSIVSPK